MKRDVVAAHYVRLLGRPSRSNPYDSRAGELDVWAWSLVEQLDGMTAYATLGASFRPTPGGDPTHRFEIYSFLSRDVGPSYDESLADVAVYPWQVGHRLAGGHTIRLTQPLWPQSGMAAFLLLDAGSEGLIPSFASPSGHHVIFLQAIPVWDDEIGYKRTKGGLQALLSLWEEKHVSFWDPERPSSVS